jgi:periplasmic divalent cation tolerance protein
MTEEYCVILTTVGDKDEADRLAEMLVSRKLAACVQITPVSSVYTWKGALQKEPEHLLLIKTAARRFDDVEAAIRQDHSYELPEIVRLPIDAGLAPYLDWISQSTQ